jgi:methylmalonic aciduria homocystinuria type C protein
MSPIDTLKRNCSIFGLDLVHPFSLAWLEGKMSFALPNYGRTNALGVIVGNTVALWSPFVRALDEDEAVRTAEHPLDTYVTRAIERATSELPARSTILWAHDMEPAPLPIQRVAELAGFAKIAPSHLSIHPEFGPWISLRAVVVVDAEGPSGCPPAMVDHCATCARPCVVALDQALAASGTNETKIGREPSNILRAWRAWLRVRTVCPIGTLYRYGDEQAEYHYAKTLPVIR